MFVSPMIVFESPITRLFDPEILLLLPLRSLLEPVQLIFTVLFEPITLFDPPLTTFPDPEMLLELPVRLLLEPRTPFVFPFTWLLFPEIVLSAPVPLLFDPDTVLLDPTKVLLPVSWIVWLVTKVTVFEESSKFVVVC